MNNVPPAEFVAWLRARKTLLPIFGRIADEIVAITKERDEALIDKVIKKAKPITLCPVCSKPCAGDLEVHVGCR